MSAAHLQHRRRALADGPFVLLGLLGVLLAAALAIFVARASLPFAPFAECRTLTATLVARLGGAGLLLPLWLLSVVCVAVLVASGHQLWVTRRVLANVLAPRLPISPRLAAAVQAAHLEQAVDFVAAAVPFTFCYGLLRPRVCVSDALVALLDDAELAAVLRHEAHHRRHRDPLKILVSRALAAGLFFLPLAGALRDGFLAGKELTADDDAAVNNGRLPLASALLKLLRSERPAWPAGVVAVGALSPTEMRLHQLIQPAGDVRPLLPSLCQWVLSAALVMAFFAFSFGTVAAGHDPNVQAVCAGRLAPTLTEAVAHPLGHPLGQAPAAAAALGRLPVVASAGWDHWGALETMRCTVGLNCPLLTRCDTLNCN